MVLYVIRCYKMIRNDVVIEGRVMAEKVLMPKAGITVEECVITEWVKQVGDTVAVGEVLFHYETDKATFECESTASGQILAILAAEGDEVPVLEAVCVIGEPGESYQLDEGDVTGDDEQLAIQLSQTKGTQLEDRRAEDQQAELMQVDKNITATSLSFSETAMPGGEEGNHIKISPRAKGRAMRAGIDIGNAVGTGPAGRIIEQDIQVLEQARFGSGAQGQMKVDSGIEKMQSGVGSNIVSDDEYEDVKFTGMRKATAKAMMTSLTTTAQVTNQHSYDVTVLRDVRNRIKESGDLLGLTNVSYNDMIVYVVSRVIQNHPDLNAHVIESNVLRRFKNVHIGIAVDTTKGLYVPVVRNANLLSLNQISMEIKRLAALCQEGNVTPDLFAGGTFTISNLGALGVEMFTPVINPPQTAILGVCGITTRVRSDEQGYGLICYPSMNLALTYDHCVIDGSPASRFLKELCETLENFDLFMMKG